MTRHDNGISAEAYVALVDIDPPLTEQVLNVLASHDIAGYVEPIEGDRGPYQDVQLPERILVRLHVDRDHVEDARELVLDHLPRERATFLADSAARDDREAMAEVEVDAAWQRIVAGYDTPSEAVGRWSAAEDVDDTEPTPPPRSGLSSRLVRRADTWDDGYDDLASGRDVYDDYNDYDDHPDDPDNHYIPPPPPPLPEAHPVTRLAWAGILGGPALVLLIAVLGIQIEPWVILLALLAFCGGFATLVARMRDRAPQDDGWDDGAVV